MAVIQPRGSREFAVEREQLFDYIADPLNDPDWCPLVLASRHVRGAGAGAVYQWEQMVSETDSIPMEVVLEVDRPNRIVWVVDNDAFDYRSEMTFEDLGDGRTLVNQANRTDVKAAPADARERLQEQGEATMQRQFDNLAETFATQG